MSQLPNIEAWLSVEQLALLCRVSSATIHRAVKSGKIKPNKVGRRLLFSQEAVAAYFNFNHLKRI
jgi:excisionase family DNA binding protein